MENNGWRVLDIGSTGGSTCQEATNSVAGIARAIYECTFRLIADKFNETLCNPTMKKCSYIGVLDIAGKN